MTVKVNLLPASYRQARRRRGRFRLVIGIGAALLVAELGAGVVLHLRTAKTRDLLDQAGRAREAAQAMEKRLTSPERKAALLRQQVALATELRTTHRWSRLLTILGNATPEKVVLVAIATNPPRWMPRRDRAQTKEPRGRSEEPPEAKPSIKGIVLNGYAADHDDLGKFMASLRASGAFASIDLKDFRRDQFLSQDAIMFELRCHW